MTSPGGSLAVTGVIENYTPVSKFVNGMNWHGKNFVVKAFLDSNYIGEMEKAQRHGKGIMVYDSGRVYEGEWRYDKRHGKGYEKYANGNTYTGDYKKGKPHGKGIYKWANQEVYDGEWKDGLKHGYGIWTG